MRVDFNGGHLGAGAREPDCGIATQCANLEDGFGVDEAALDSEVLALEGGDGDCGEIVGGGVGEGVIEFWIRF